MKIWWHRTLHVSYTKALEVSAIIPEKCCWTPIVHCQRLSQTSCKSGQKKTQQENLAPAITQHSQKCSVLQTSAGYLESKVKVQADAELTLTKIVISEAFFF